MNHSSKYVLAFALPASLGIACSGDAEDDASPVASICQRACATKKSLNCPDDPPDCQAECESTNDVIPANCRSQALTLGECGATRPATDWECDSFGESTLEEGVCESEATALLICVFGQ